jgi:hypothetical protein
MQRKIRLPVAANDVLTLVPMNGAQAKHIKLVKFKLDNNRIEWEFRSLERHVICSANDPRLAVRLPYFNEETWICLSLPICIHVGSDGLKADFIVNVPSSVKVQRNAPSANGLFE